MSTVEIITEGGAPIVEVTASPAVVVEVMAKGPKGDGVPESGTTAQVLRKKSGANFDTEWHSLAKADVGLPNVDNTSDVDKPVSTAQQTALNTKEPTITPDVEASYWTGIKTWRTFAADVRNTLLTGLSTAAGTTVTAAHSLLEAVGFLQKQISDNLTTLTNHTGNTANPHGTTKDQVGLGNVLNVAQIPASEKGAANGVAPLGADSKVPAAYLPGYVDDVLEVANYAALPATGSTGIMYVTLDTNNVYRWSGSAYIEIAASPGSTDEVAEGVTNKYFTAARVADKAPLDSPQFTGVIRNISGEYIGKADNTGYNAIYGGTAYNTGGGIVAYAESHALRPNEVVITNGAFVERMVIRANGEVQFQTTNAVQVPVGTSAQRPAGANGKIRYNADLKAYEGYAEGSWTSIGGGAKGAPGNAVFYENAINVTGSYTITTGYNAMTAGPITINDGAVVTVPDGSTLTIV